MGRYRNYSDEDKSVALAYLASVRHNYQAASKHTGIPWTTLQAWHKGIGVKDIPDNVRSKVWGDLANSLQEKIWLMLDEGFQVDKIRDTPVNALGSTIGTFVDRVRLLNGESTEIHGDDGKPRQINIAYTDRAGGNPDAVPAPAPPDAETTDR